MMQLVVLARTDKPGGEMAPLGNRTEIVAATAPFNTAPDRDDSNVLYGPGVRLELPDHEPITQMLLTITEEEIAWQVIIRMAKSLHWRLFDPASGRELNP